MGRLEADDRHDGARECATYRIVAIRNMVCQGFRAAMFRAATEEILLGGARRSGLDFDRRRSSIARWPGPQAMAVEGVAQAGVATGFLRGA